MTRKLSMSELLNLARTSRGVALVGSGSRVFALGSQFVIVLILTRLFAKADFGNFMTVFAGYRLLATGVGTGLASVLLYHVSRAEETHDTEIRLHRFALIIGAIVAVMLCVGEWIAADPLSAELAKPGLAMWLKWMTPFLFFTLMSTITTGSFEGRSQVSTAIFMTEVFPNFMRLVLLGALPFTGLPTIWIAHLMAASVAIPWLVSVRHLWGGEVRGAQRFTSWDYWYAGKLTLYNFAALQVQGVDMIVAGWMFSSESVADYAVASRIAALFPFFLQLRVRMFGPVAGKLLGQKRYDELQKEVLIAKDFATIMVTLSVAGLLLASPVFLHIFWKSQTFSVLLVLLSFPPTYRSLFAAGDRLLQLAGHANWNLGIMLAALAIVVIIPLLTGSHLGVIALPIAMIISGTLLNPVISFAVGRTTGIRLLRKSDFLVILLIAVSAAVPLIFAKGALLMVWSGGMYLLVAAFVYAQHHRALRVHKQ